MVESPGFILSVVMCFFLYVSGFIVFRFKNFNAEGSAASLLFRKSRLVSILKNLCLRLQQARPPLNFTLALQGPTVDQLASQPQAADILKRALADLLPGVCEFLFWMYMTDHWQICCRLHQ